LLFLSLALDLASPYNHARLLSLLILLLAALLRVTSDLPLSESELFSSFASLSHLWMLRSRLRCSGLLSTRLPRLARRALVQLPLALSLRSRFTQLPFSPSTSSQVTTRSLATHSAARIVPMPSQAFDLEGLGKDWEVRKVEGKHVAVFLPGIEQSPNDDRHYRCVSSSVKFERRTSLIRTQFRRLVTLRNGLTAMLISDRKTDKGKSEYQSASV